MGYDAQKLLARAPFKRWDQYADFRDAFNEANRGLDVHLAYMSETGSDQWYMAAYGWDGAIVPAQYKAA